jgi:hypothetical protein
MNDKRKQFITLRVSRSFADEVRRLAERETETQSTIFRRLLRLGLHAERRNLQHAPDEAA